MSSKIVLRFVLGLALALPLPMLAQRQSPMPQPPTDLSRPPLPSDDNEARAKAEREMAKKQNRDRQAAIQKDTDKLLELATQLKDNVDKSTENTLSVDVIKKAEEIEKLAHTVKEKMKGN